MNSSIKLLIINIVFVPNKSFWTGVPLIVCSQLLLVVMFLFSGVSLYAQKPDSIEVQIKTDALYAEYKGIK